MDNSTPHAPYFHLKWGIFFILCAWFLLTAMATLSKFASEETPLSMVIFFQNFISHLVFLPWVVRHGIRSLRTERFGLIFARSLSGFIGFAALFLALKFTTVTNAVLLNNATPLLLPFLIWAWKKKPVNHQLWPGILGGFLGIAFILKPTAAVFQSGALFGLVAGVCGAFNFLAMRILSYTERTHTVLFYYSLISSLLCLPFALYNWKAPTWEVWMELIAIGLIFSLTSWCFMRAFHHAKAAVLGPFTYVSVAFSAFFDWAIWNRVPDGWSWVGIALICSGGLWTVSRARSQE